jgi:hypothetical protein
MRLCTRVKADKTKDYACLLIRVPAIVLLTLFTLKVPDSNG